MRAEKITFACVTKPHLDRLKKLLPHVMPYVDRCVLVLGERDEKTIKYLQSLGDKVDFYYHPWEDDFAKQWNNYLSHIEDGWVIICDDDETPSQLLLENLNGIVNQSQLGDRFCFVDFRCHPISGGVMADEPANYWRQIFFRYNPNMFYKGGPKTGCHQYIVGHQNGRGVRSDLTYYHEKSLEDEYRNASRNYFIYGIWLHGSIDGDQREEWHELKEVLSRVYPNVKTFPNLDKEMKEGNVHPELKEWLTKWYNKYKTHSEYNEMRAMYTYYFKYLHPEEAPE